MAILNTSASKNGLAPNSKTGLSHPINVPNHNNPKRYIVEVARISLPKTTKKPSSNSVIFFTISASGLCLIWKHSKLFQGHILLYIGQVIA